jgi:hypothetical protein
MKWVEPHPGGSMRRAIFADIRKSLRRNAEAHPARYTPVLSVGPAL